MKYITQHQGKLTLLKREKNSINGNPRYSCKLANGVAFKTGVDSFHGYTITNFENKLVDVTIGLHYNTPTLISIQEV